MCDNFSDQHIRVLAAANNIPTARKTKNLLCDNLIFLGKLPVINPPDAECDRHALARLRYQARELNIPNSDMYTQKTKQELCDKIRESLDVSGMRNEYRSIRELNPDEKCIDNLTTLSELKERARQIGIFGYGSLDRSTLCYLIRRETSRIAAGGIPRDPLPERKKKEALPNTYDRFVLPDEQKLSIPQLSRALTTKLLRAEQILPAVYLSTHRGMILSHAVGTGKTFAAINTSQVLLRKGIVQRVIVITPTSLQYNFIQQFQAYNKDLSTDPRYTYYTPQLFHNGVVNNKIKTNEPTLLIVDEAHNYRSDIWGMGSKYSEISRRGELLPKDEKEYTDLSGQWSGGRIRSLFKFIRYNNVSRVLLMTATPFVNEVYDIENLLAMIENRPPRFLSPELDKIEALYKDSCNIHYYESSEEYKSQFPVARYHSRIFEMSQDYFQEYYNVQTSNIQGSNMFRGGSLTSFYNGVRRASNKLDYSNSDKLTALVRIVEDDVKSDPETRILVYSSWIEAGLKSLNEDFTARGLRCGSITGRMSKTARMKTVQDLNSGRLNVLMISKAGGEGLDLKGVRKVYIVEPTWNDASIQQIIGRAVRYQSHAHLPVEKRVVDIYTMMLLKPFEAALVRLGDYRAQRLLSDPEVMGKYDQITQVPDKKLDQLRRVINIDRESGLQSENYDDMMSIDLYLYKFMKKKKDRLDKALDYVKSRSIVCYNKTVDRIKKDIESYQPPQPIIIVPRSEEISEIKQVEIEDEDEKKMEINDPQYRKIVIEDDESYMEKSNRLRREVRDLMSIPDQYVYEGKVGSPMRYRLDAPLKRFVEIPAEVKVKGSEEFKLLADRKKVQVLALVDVEEEKIQLAFFYKNDNGDVVTEKITL